MTLTLLDGRGVISLLAEYLDGVAPPVPSLDLHVQDARGTSRIDHDSGIVSWTVTMTGEDVARVYRQAPTRIFARNIRGYLGDTKINHEMQRTIKNDPKSFWYLNNGITIVCNEARFEQDDHGREILSLGFPQIINGQQTTRALAQAASKDAAKANVSVRVVSIPRDSVDHYDHLVSQIVRATNWKNVIKPADLMSNDPRQSQLEREFRKLNYLYVRKRQLQAEAKKVGFKYKEMIRKEDLANTFGACLAPSLPRNVGLQPLFEDPHYERIFGKRNSAKDYLCCFWHYRNVHRQSRGSGEKIWAKFVVVYFLWDHFRAEIQRFQDRFIGMCEGPRLTGNRKLNAEYQRLISTTYDSALRYYRADRGRGIEAVEVSPFFKRSGSYDGFARFWPKRTNASLRTRFNKSASRFKALLAEPLD